MSQTLIISTLREEISELSLVIDAQQAILHDLLTRRAKARYKLNCYSDPMARLPLEIQSHILLSVDSDNCSPKPFPKSPPMVFLGVCRLWRDIAVSTPKLWAKLRMDSLPRGPNHSELCGLWLKRARSLPLSVELHGPATLDQSVQDLVARHSHQLTDLTLSISFEYLDNPQLLHTTWKPRAGSLSSLKTLSIEASSDHAYIGDMCEWLDVMQAAPVITRCKMLNTFHEEKDGLPLIRPHLTLGSLETLELGDPHVANLHGENGSSAVILRYLNLPALKTLIISDLDITPEEFLSFLSLSSPPLQSLRTLVPPEWLHPIVDYLGLIPTLTALDLFALPDDGGLTGDQLHPVIDALRTAPDLLPNIRELGFHTACPVTVDYEKVLSMLRFRFTSCSTPLERFVLSFPQHNDRDHNNDMPNEEVRAGLRQLVEDGLKIHIGHTDNLL
ncbi:F-box domain-containing protein [Favolaschia claudopus]|uniref:F-box domain-containing protein n=1 Tax=Favolaschia claudopus TaxID=2862362 RepID=A0AAW0D9Q8_9AGAR